MSDATLELKLWRWQRRSALILLPLVAFHVCFQLFVVGIDRIDFSGTAARLSGGLMIVIDLLLLAAAVGHGLLGLRSIAIDYARSSGAARHATLASMLLFAAVFVYGVAALVALR